MIEHDFVVGQESPEIRIDFRIPVFGESEGHGDRERVGVRRAGAKSRCI